MPQLLQNCQISKYRFFSTLKLISTKAQKSYDNWYLINPEASWVKKTVFLVMTFVLSCQDRQDFMVSN